MEKEKGGRFMLNQELLRTLSVISPEEQALLAGQQLNREIYMDMGAPSNVIDAGKLLQSGRLITIRPHTRFAHFPEHSHNYVEVVYMCQGSTTHIANGTPVTLKQGELLFFGQGAKQEILPAGERDIAVNFIILPQFFDKVLEMLDADRTPLRTFLVESLGSGNTGYLHFRVADVLPVQNLVENLIYTLLSANVPNRRSICQTTMGLLAASTSSRYIRHRPSGSLKAGFATPKDRVKSSPPQVPISLEAASCSAVSLSPLKMY